MQSPNKELYMNKWTLEVKSDPDDPESVILTFPDDLLASVGWVPGDKIIWKENEDGSWTLTKKIVKT